MTVQADDDGFSTWEARWAESLRGSRLPPGGDVGDAVDLGPLKGNKGDQQYAVPRGARAGTVTIWCRAFTVAFGSARLRVAG